MIDFLGALWGELGRGRRGEIRSLWNQPLSPNVDPLSVPRYNAQRWFADWDGLVEYALEMDREGRDVYFGVLPRAYQNGGNDAIDDFSQTIWADFDGKSFGSQVGAFHALASVAPRPQIVVDSGNGYHAYWLLDDFYPFGDVHQVMKGISLEAGSDSKATDKARILRVPGTHNHKDPANLKPVRLLRFNLMGRRHPLADFIDYADHATYVERKHRPTKAVSTSGDWDPSDETAPKFPDGERNSSLTRLAGIMVDRGVPPDELPILLENENQMRCDPPLPAREVAAIARSVERYRR